MVVEGIEAESATPHDHASGGLGMLRCAQRGTTEWNSAGEAARSTALIVYPRSCQSRSIQGEALFVATSIANGVRHDKLPT